MNERFSPSHRELLEDLLAMSARQTRLLEEIRDLLAAQRRMPANDSDSMAEDRFRSRSHN
jgi:hypothetical protein